MINNYIIILIKLIIFLIFSLLILSKNLYACLNDIFNNYNLNNKTKVALCTMGKKENLYAKQFVDYYINLGIDHIFIYDDNEEGSERISSCIPKIYKEKVTIYENIKSYIKKQSHAFTKCYYNNYKKFDWLLMIDMDEYLYIINNTLKSYLMDKSLDKCDFVKFHTVIPTDNNLIHYDERFLLERFKGPYIKQFDIKTIIRGNITNLIYNIHSPSSSPQRNITCNNKGDIIYDKDINLGLLMPINLDKAFIIHFKYKSTEEFINKYQRGYSNWFSEKENNLVLNTKLKGFFLTNEITLEKIDYIERKLHLNLSSFKNDFNNLINSYKTNIINNSLNISILY